MNDIIHNLVPEISRGFTWVNSGSSGTSIRHPSSSVRCRCSLLSLYFAMRSRSFITYNGMTGIHYTYQMQGKINDAIFELYALIIVYLTPTYPLFKRKKYINSCLCLTDFYLRNIYIFTILISFKVNAARWFATYM